MIHVVGFRESHGGRRSSGYRPVGLGDCVVRAVAVAAQLPYRDVLLTARALNRVLHRGSIERVGISGSLLCEAFGFGQVEAACAHNHERLVGMFDGADAHHASAFVRADWSWAREGSFLLFDSSDWFTGRCFSVDGPRLDVQAMLRDARWWAPGFPGGLRVSVSDGRRWRFALFARYLNFAVIHAIALSARGRRPVRVDAQRRRGDPWTHLITTSDWLRRGDGERRLRDAYNEAFPTEYAAR